MRTLFVVGLLGFGIAAAAPAQAADYDYPAISARAAPILVYDCEPGVVMRAYWRAPWRNRHYFPRGKTIKAAVHRGASTRRPARRIRPAQSFHREWSTSSEIRPYNEGTEHPEPEMGLADRNERAGSNERIIHAQADVTILGPDRMNIRLFRKRAGAGAE